MANVVENEKRFEHFDELLPETRKVVIDEMQPVERCRFTRCSKMCQKEGKVSKNYIYGLSFLVDSIHCPYVPLEISVNFDKNRYGFILKFYINRITGKKYKVCVDRHGGMLWKIELDRSTDVIQHCTEYFKNILELYQNTIQSLSLECSQHVPKDCDFGIQTLKNLKTLEMRCDLDISRLFSKLRKPLKELVVDGRKTTQNIVDFEEVHQVQNRLILYAVNLNYEQLSRLTANYIRMDIGSLTEMDIFNLFRSWQNSNDWKKTSCYDLDLSRTSFSVERLLNLLGIAGFDGQKYVQHFYIKHFKDDRKISEIEYYDSSKKMQLRM